MQSSRGLADQFQPLSVNNTWARLQSIKSGSSSERFKTIQPSRFAGKTGPRQLKARLQASSCMNAASTKKAFHHGDLELLQVPSVSKCLARSILPKHSAVLREYIELWARSPHSRATADDLLQSRWEQASHPQPCAQPGLPNQVIEPEALASHLEEQAMALRIGGIGSSRTQLGRKQPGLHNLEGAGGSAKLNEQMLVSFTERMIERLKMLEMVSKDGEGSASRRNLGDAWSRDHLDGIIASLSHPARVKFARLQGAKDAKINIHEDVNNQQDNNNTQQYRLSSAFGPAEEEEEEAEAAEQRESGQDLALTKEVSAPASPSSGIRQARGGAIYRKMPSLIGEHVMPEDTEQRDWNGEARWEANVGSVNALMSPLLASGHMNGHEASTNVEVGQKEEKKKQKHSYVETLPPAVTAAPARSDGSLQLPLKSGEVLQLLDSPIATRDACPIRQTIPTKGDESDKEEQEEVSSSTAGRGGLGAVAAKRETSILTGSTPQRQPASAAFHSNRVVLEQFQNRRNSQKIGYLKKKRASKRIKNRDQPGDRGEHWIAELNLPTKRSVSPYSPVRLAQDFDVKYSNQFVAKLQQQKRLEEFCMECILQEEQSVTVKMGEQAQIEVNVDVDAPQNASTRQACAPLIEHDVCSNSPGSSATPASALNSLHLGSPIGSRQSQPNNDTMLAVAPSKGIQAPSHSQQPATFVAAGRREAPCQQPTLKRLSSNIATPKSQQRAGRKGSLCELDIQDREALTHSACGPLIAAGGASGESIEKVKIIINKTHGAGSATTSNREPPKDLEVQPENGAAANAKEPYQFTRLAKFKANSKLGPASQSPEKLCKDPSFVSNPALATIQYDNGIELASNRKSSMDIYQTRKLEGDSRQERNENEPRATKTVNQISMVDDYALESRENLKSDDEHGLEFAEAWYTELMGSGGVESRQHVQPDDNHLKENSEGPGEAGDGKHRVVLLDSALQTDSIETIKARRAAHTSTQYQKGRIETKGQHKGQSCSIQRSRLGVGAGRSGRLDQEHFMEVFGVSVGKANRQQQKDGYQANGSQFQNTYEASIQNQLTIANRLKINNNGFSPFGQQQAFKIPSSTTQGLFVRSPHTFGNSSNQPTINTCTPKKQGYPVNTQPKCSLAFHHGAVGAYDATGLTERGQNTVTLNQSIQQNVPTPDKGVCQQQQYSERSINLGQDQAKGADVYSSTQDQEIQREGKVESSRYAVQKSAEKEMRKDTKHPNEATLAGGEHQKDQEYQEGKTGEVEYISSNLVQNDQNAAQVKVRRSSCQAAGWDKPSGMATDGKGFGTEQKQSSVESNQATTKGDGLSQHITALRHRGADGPGRSMLRASTKRLGPQASMPKRTGRSILNSTLLSPTIARGKDNLMMNQKQAREVVVVHLTPGSKAAEAAAPRAQEACNQTTNCMTFATQGTHYTQNSPDQMRNTKKMDAEQAEAPSKQPTRHDGALNEPIKRNRVLSTDSKTMTLPLSAGNQFVDGGQHCQVKQDQPRQEQELGLESSDVPFRDERTLLNSGVPVSGTATNKSALVSEDGAIMTTNLHDIYLSAKAGRQEDAQCGKRSMQRKQEATLGWPAGTGGVRRHHAGRALTVEPRYRQAGSKILNSDVSHPPEVPLKSSNFANAHQGAQSRILPHNVNFGIEQLPRTGTVFNKFTFRPKQSQPSSLMRKIKPQSLSKERGQPKTGLVSAEANPPVDPLPFNQLLIPQLFSSHPGSVVWDNPHPGRSPNEAVRPGVSTPSSTGADHHAFSPWRTATSGPMYVPEQSIERAERDHQGADRSAPFFDRRAAGARLRDSQTPKTIQHAPKLRYPDKEKGRQNDTVATAKMKQPEARAPSLPPDREYIPIEQISYAARPQAQGRIANQVLDTMSNNTSWQPLLAQMLSDSACGSTSSAEGLGEILKFEMLRQYTGAVDPADVLPQSLNSKALAGYGLDQLMTLQQQLQAQILLQQQLQIQKNQQHLRYTRREPPQELEEAKLRTMELQGQLNTIQALGQGYGNGLRAPVSLVADLRPLAEQARPAMNGRGEARREEEGESWLQGGGRAWTEGAAFQQNIVSPGSDRWSQQYSFGGNRELAGDFGLPAQEFQRYVAASAAGRALLDDQSSRQGQNMESGHLSPTCQVKKYRESPRAGTKTTQERAGQHPELCSHVVPIYLDAYADEPGGDAVYQLKSPTMSFLDAPGSGYNLLQGHPALGAGATIILSAAALSAFSGPGEPEAPPDRATHGGALPCNEPDSLNTSARRGFDDSAMTEIGQQHTPGATWVASTGTILVIGRDPQADLPAVDKPPTGSAGPKQASTISENSAAEPNPSTLGASSSADRRRKPLLSNPGKSAMPGQ